ncbi:ankyrin repeat-containing domain protein [Baffinella frigidus]|nr:ankyrin repeat-containing domain protein [Cryptophyta sp. CCMP2293]
MNLNKAEKRQQRWLDACRRGQAEEVQQLILEGANVLKRNYGETVLISAAQYGNHRVVKVLLDAGAEVEAVSRAPGLGAERFTALRWAVSGGHEEVVRILLDAGADVAATCPAASSTALLDATKRGDVGVVRILLDAGADVAVNLPGGGIFGGTALHMAAKKRCPQMVRMLLDKGADVNVENMQGHRPLHLAAEDPAMPGYPSVDPPPLVEVARMLLYAGADIAAITGYGATALTLALEALANSPPLQMERIREVVDVLQAAEQARRYEANAMAFAMGLQERLGAASVVRGLDTEVLRMVILADAGACTWFRHREL